MSRMSSPTMRLAALSAGGQAARGRFNGAVHSVFRQACNIRLDDGRMLALLAPPLGNVPHGVRVDAPAGFVFSRHLAVGQRVGCRADVLRVEGGLAFDLGSAHAWRGELSSVNVDLMVPAVTQAWRAAWYALRRGRARADHVDAPTLSRTVDRQGVRLARVARALQSDEAARTLERVIGCGPGLTPSGDDLITGFLAGLFSTTCDDRARRAFLEAFCRAVAAAAAIHHRHQPYVSHPCRRRVVCRAAGHARAPHRCRRGPWHGRQRHDHRAAGGPHLGRRGRPRAAARPGRLGTPGRAAWGHTSGGAGVLGLLLGLVAWTPEAALLEPAWPRQLRAGLALTGQTSFQVRPDRPHAAHRALIPPWRSNAALSRTLTFAC